ncbi:putative conserved membrane protein [Synechococcus sp. A15-62]|nr:putative conserved membrane protein [Synechococcus sp. A15-62]
MSGLALATLGVSGLAGGGLLWNFQGRTLGLGSTITSLVLLGISFVLLRPEPRLTPVEVSESSQPLKIKAPQASFLGLMLAILGTFGMAGSGLLWNFQGLAFGLTGTLTAAVALLLSLVFLWPLGGAKAKSPLKVKPVETTEAVSESEPPAQTTAEAIAELLAAEQEEQPELTLVNFAPLNLLPGQSVPTKSRRAGSSLGRYRSMASDLFKN